jgi:hypothetical protein
LTSSQLQVYCNLYANSLTITPTQLSYLNALTSPFSSDLQTQINTINGTLSNISNTNGTTSGATVLANTVRFSGTTTFQGVSTLNLNGPVSVTGNITANALTVSPTNLGNVSGLSDLPVIVSTAQTIGGIKTFTGACVFSNAGAGVSFTGTAPTLSGANITSGSIPSTSINLSNVNLTGNLTLVPQAFFSTPSVTQLGYTLVGNSPSNVQLTSGTTTTIASWTLGQGVWLVSAQLTLGTQTPSPTFTQYTINIQSLTWSVGGSSNSISGQLSSVTISNNSISTNGSMSYNISGVLTVTSSQSAVFNVIPNFTATISGSKLYTLQGTGVGTWFSITRIA